MTDDATPRGNGCLRALGVFAIVLLILAAAVVGSLWHWLHRATTPPDVARVARSSVVASADDRAVPRLDRHLADVLSGTPWFTAGARSADDTCGSEAGGFFGEGFSPVSCTRTVTQILVCDCDVAAHNAVWGRVLAQAGWNSSEPLGAAPAAGGRPAGSASYSAADFVGLQITWGSGVDRPLVHPPWRMTVEHPAPHAGARVDVDAAVTEALTRHRAVAVVSVTSRYYDPAAGTRADVAGP